MNKFDIGEEVLIKGKIHSLPHKKNNRYISIVDEHVGNWNYRSVECTEESIINKGIFEFCKKTQIWAMENKFDYILDMLVEYELFDENIKLEDK